MYSLIFTIAICLILHTCLIVCSILRHVSSRLNVFVCIRTSNTHTLFLNRIYDFITLSWTHLQNAEFSLVTCLTLAFCKCELQRPMSHGKGRCRIKNIVRVKQVSFDDYELSIWGKNTALVQYWRPKTIEIKTQGIS